jgi:hypothetical protein
MTTDKNGNSVRYGRVNMAMIGAWARLAPENDGPFWALNLMKYREVADYGDGRPGARTGREADDEYTPREALAGIGAQIVFAAEVDRILVGDGTAWDRIGIVRYPSRRRFLEMQQRDDFKKKHVHKDAGMEFTIVMSCLPVEAFAGSTERHSFVELRIAGGAAAAPPPLAGDAGVFDVEGVIVGDERTWTQASFRWIDRDDEAPVAQDIDRDAYVMRLRPGLDRLSRSVFDARSSAATES